MINFCLGKPINAFRKKLAITEEIKRILIFSKGKEKLKTFTLVLMMKAIIEILERIYLQILKDFNNCLKRLPRQALDVILMKQYIQ